MSSAITSTTTSATTLANALLNLGSAPAQNAPGGSNPSAGIDLDNLQLSGSSLSDLEAQAQEIAAQNQNSIISTSEDALAANLQAVAAIAGGSSDVQAAQSNTDAASVLSLMS